MANFPLEKRTGEWTLHAVGEITANQYPVRDDQELEARQRLYQLVEGAHQDYLMVAFADLYPEGTYLQWLHRIAYPIYLKTRHWATVRRLALEAAHDQCVLCGSTQRLEVHHKTYDTLGRERLADLSVLCRNCHGKHHGKPA